MSEDPGDGYDDPRTWDEAQEQAKNGGGNGHGGNGHDKPNGGGSYSFKDIESVGVGGHYYVRNTAGKLVDVNSGQEFDLTKLLPRNANVGVLRRTVQYKGEAFTCEVDGKFRNRKGGVLARAVRRLGRRV
jgi:hypothetical protein